MSNDNKRKLYDALSQDYDMGTYEQFCKDIQDETKRKKLYDATSEAYDYGDYAKFSSQLGFGTQAAAPSTTPATPVEDVKPEKQTAQPKQKQAWQPTPMQKAFMSHAAQSAVDKFKASSDAMLQRSQNTMDYYRKGGGITGAPVKGKMTLNPESGTVEQTYLTPTGTATADKAAAERETRAFNEYVDNMTVAGQLRRAGRDLQELHRKRDARVQAIHDEWAEDYRKNTAPLAAVLSAGTYRPSIEGDQEYRALTAAIHQAEKRVQTLQHENDRQQGKDVGFWRGFVEVVGDIKTWDFGYSGLMDAMTMLDASKPSPKARPKTEGQKAAQQTMLEQTAEAQEAERAYGQNDSFWNRAGVMTGEMLPFMLDFALMGGSNSGTSAVTRTIDAALLKSLRSAAPKVARNKAAQWTVKALGAMPEDLLYRAPLMTNTVQGMKTASDIIDRKLGDVVVREDGTYDFSNDKSWGSAIWQGEANAIIENYSEMFGTHLEGVLSLNTLGKIADTFGAKRLSGVLARASNSELAGIAGTMQKHLNQLGVSDYFGEVGEEYYGQLWRTMLNLDDAYKQNPDGTRTNLFLDGQFHGDIWGGMALSMGLMGAGKYTLSAAAYGSMKHNVNKTDARAAEIFTPEVWNSWRERIDGTTNADIGAMAESIITDTSLTPEQRDAAMNYMEASLNLRGFNLASVARQRGGEQTAEEAAANESYMDGYSATTPQEMNDAKRMLDLQRQRLASSLSDDMVQEYDADPIGALSRTADPELRRIAADYVNAKQVYDGMIQRVRDDVDARIAQSDAMIDSRVNRETGMIQPATMKIDDRPVYIVNGNVAMYEDGTGVDTENSSESIIIRDAETGKIEFADPSQVLNIGEGIDAETEKEAARNQITQEIAQAAANNIDGVLSFAPGETYSVLDIDGNPEDITILGNSTDEEGQPVDWSVDIQYADGTIQSVPTADLQQWVDAANDQRVAQFAEERAAERAAADEADRQADETGLSNPNRDRSLLPDNWEMPYYGFNTTASRYIESERGTGGMLYQDEQGNDAIVVSAIDDNNYVGYFREYDEQGNPTNRWSAKFQNGSGLRENHRDMMQTAQELLPAGHELTEHKSVSTDGLRNLANQLKHGYELQRDEEGNVITNRVAVNMMARENDLGLPESYFRPGSEANVRIRLEEDERAEVNTRLAQFLAPFGLDESAIHWEGNKLYVDHPVLRRADTPQQEEEPGATETAESVPNPAENAEIEGQTAAEAVSNDGVIDIPSPDAAEVEAMLAPEEPQPTALSQIPTDEKGDPIYEQADPGTAWDALLEETEDEQIAQNVIAQEIAEREDALKKLDKQKPKAGLTTKEKIKAEKEKKKAMDDIRKSIEHWKRMSATKQKRQAEADAKEREEARRRAEERRAQEEQARAEREEAERKEREALNGVPDWSRDTPQDARARGYRRYGAGLVERQQRTPDNDQGLGKEVEPMFRSGAKPVISRGRFHIGEVDSYQPSHIDGKLNPYHFINEAQPKKRHEDGGVSSNTADLNAKNIKPALVTRSEDAFNGAPIVNYRREAIQGNGRIQMLRYLYERYPEQAAQYKQYLIDHAEDFGVSTEYIASLERPIVTMMLDVEDNEAIKLGNIDDKEMTSGGKERIRPANTLQTMREYVDKEGRKRDMTSTFANLLLRSVDDEDTFSQLVERNGAEVLSWMNRNGFITDTQYSSAFDSKHNLTPGAAEDLRGIMYQSIFQDGATSLEEMFYRLPAKAQRAILATAFRDYDSSRGDRMVEEIQQSIMAYSDMMQYEPFASAGNIKDATGAMESWKRQYAMDDVTGEPFLPAEKFSNFALALAAIYKGGSQRFIQQTFNDLYDTVQGTAQDTLFEEADKTPKPLAEAIRKVLDLEYKPIKQEKENGENDHSGSDAMDLDTEAGEAGRPGSDGNAESGEPGEDGGRDADSGAGATEESGAGNDVAPSPTAAPTQTPKAQETATEAEEATPSTGRTEVEAGVAKGQEIDTNPSDAQKEAGNYKKGHVTIEGMQISIENPKGSVRKGTDADGTPWETTMTLDYGYIRGTQGKDKDHIDIFLTDVATDAEWLEEMGLDSVFVIDQYNKDGSFDEHKIVYGLCDKIQALDEYLDNYSSDWAEGRRLEITEVSMEDFKAWAFDGHRKVKPFAEYWKNTTKGKTIDPWKAEDRVRYAKLPNKDRVIDVGWDSSNGFPSVIIAHPTIDGVAAEITFDGKKWKVSAIPVKEWSELSEKAQRAIDKGIRPEKQEEYINTYIPKTMYDYFTSGRAVEENNASVRGETEYGAKERAFDAWGIIFLNANTNFTNYPHGSTTQKDPLQDEVRQWIGMKGFEPTWGGTRNAVMRYFKIGFNQAEKILKAIAEENAITAQDEAEPTHESSDSAPSLAAIEESVIEKPTAEEIENWSDEYGACVAELIDWEDYYAWVEEEKVPSDKWDGPWSIEEWHAFLDEANAIRSKLSLHAPEKLAEIDKWRAEEEAEREEEVKAYEAEQAAEQAERDEARKKELAAWEEELKGMDNRKLSSYIRKNDGKELSDTESDKLKAARAEQTRRKQDKKPSKKKDASPSSNKPADNQKQESKPKSKWVDDEDAEEFERLRQIMRNGLGQLNMGFPPELLFAGGKMSYLMMKHGVRKFAEYAAAMIEELGDAIRPHLKPLYNFARSTEEVINSEWANELTPFDEVMAFDTQNFDNAQPDAMATAENEVAEEESINNAELMKERIRTYDNLIRTYADRLANHEPFLAAMRKKELDKTEVEGGSFLQREISKDIIGLAETEQAKLFVDKWNLGDGSLEAKIIAEATRIAHKLIKEEGVRQNPDGSTTETIKEGGATIEVTTGDFIPGVKPSIDEPKKPKKKTSKPTPTTGQLDLFGEEEEQIINEVIEETTPPEPKPETELSGDSADYQERTRQERNLVDDIVVEIMKRTDMRVGGDDRGPLTMRDIRGMLENYPLLSDISATDLQELVERAMTILTRKTAQAWQADPKKGFDRVVAYYNTQPSLNARDSERLIKQQYSTPTPFGYVMGQFVNARNDAKSILEPSAGNGALTIMFDPKSVHVNDIDERRLENLRTLGYGKVTAQNGLLPFEGEKVDGVLTNPPFGTVAEKVYDGVFKISSLEGQMAINALDSMKDGGRAAIIIGGNTSYRSNGSMNPKDAAFFGFLYSHYNVADVINISGKALYARNGTGYDVRMILIDGRKGGEFSRVYPPVKSKARAEQVTTFDELYKRVEDDIQQIIKVGNKPADGKREDRPAADGGKSTPDGSGSNRQDRGTGERPHTTGDGGGSASWPRIEQPTGRNEQSRPAGMDNGDGGNAGGTDDVQRPKPATTGSSGSGSPENDGGGSGGNGHSAATSRPNGGGERLAVKPDLTTEKVPYPNQSDNGFTLLSVVPAAQAEVLQRSLGEIGDVDQFLVDELGYSSKEELYGYLAAEQIDSVALAIHQMNKGNAFIIGDMTGVGKGRQGAALIRYGVRQGRCPIYFTQKPTLFTDNYRDLADIGSSELRPFIIASNPKDANIVDANGNVVHKLPSKKEQERVFDYIMRNGKLPKEYDYVLTTYDQIKNGTADYTQNDDGTWHTEARKLPKKSKGYTTADYNGQARRDALARLAMGTAPGQGNIAILDESHTVGGDSGCGRYMQMLTSGAYGVTFLSATFAKRADNMPIYAQRTAIAEAGVNANELIEAIAKGGVTLQEIMSKQLVESGQMIRRERSFEGVTIDWLSVGEETDRKQREQFNEVANIFNSIRNFQNDFIKPIIDGMNEAAAEQGATVGQTQGTKDLGVRNTPFASKMYNLVNQLLFALKVDAVADRVIENLRNGYKPVISFTNTMEGFLATAPKGEAMDEVPNFSLTLMRALDGVMRFTENDADQNSEGGRITFGQLSPEGQAAYNEVKEKIMNLSADLPISPMDAIRMKIEEAGYSVAEITGRTTQLNRTEDGRYIVEGRKDRDKKAAMRDFNSGKLDVLMINKSGSTGISLHASSKFEDQRQRVMVFAQFQCDINDEVQMRGRIDRSGQTVRGRYEYIMSTIPAEQRIQMMFKAKLKSLDANTTSSQKSKFNEMEIVDYLNKYGDEVVWEYMKEHPELSERLGDPLKMLKEKDEDGAARTSENEDNSQKSDCAGKISRYLAFLSVEEQDEIFKEITEAYKVKIQLLDDAGENDLEITTMPLRAYT